MSNVRPDFLQDTNACLDATLEDFFVCRREDCCDGDVEEEWGYGSSLGESVEEVKWAGSERVPSSKRSWILAPS